MLKSCSNCQSIHDSKYDCGKSNKGNKKGTDADKFRSSSAWNKKREQIKQRDNYLCQICIRKLHNTIEKYTYDNISVHHIEKVNEVMLD